MIPPFAKLAPTVVADSPGYRIGRNYFPTATRLTPGQIYSSATLRHQRTEGMVVQADYTANVMPAYGSQVRTPVNSVVQPVNHYQHHHWYNLKWYWRNMRFSLPEQDYPQVFNQMGRQVPGQPMKMQQAPRYTRVLDAPRYNTIPSGVTPVQSESGTSAAPVGTTVVGRGAYARRRFFNSAPFVAVGPDFHG